MPAWLLGRPYCVLKVEIRTAKLDAISAFRFSTFELSAPGKAHHFPVLRALRRQFTFKQEEFRSLKFTQRCSWPVRQLRLPVPAAGAALEIAPE